MDFLLDEVEFSIFKGVSLLFDSQVGRSVGRIVVSQYYV